MLRRTEQQLLSHHCSVHRKQNRREKLNLFGKGIAVVDRVGMSEEASEAIREIDLSHNAVQTIEQVGQFCNLECINLSHNRIADLAQLLKLQILPKLHSVYLKGNPCIKNTIPPYVLPFLLSLNTDISFTTNELQSKIDQLVASHLQLVCFINYQRRVDLHLQLISNFQIEDYFVNTGVSMFPKIKKVLEVYSAEMQIKREVMSKIQVEDCESEVGIERWVKRELEECGNRRSEIIRKIYEREEILRNVRSTYKTSVKPKKTILRNPTNFNLQPAVREHSDSQKHLKQRNQPSYTKSPALIPKKNSRNIENSPPRMSSQFAELKDNQYFEQTFLNVLCRMNPLYHLLHSPLPSLKSHEKQLLIQNLTLHLKQKMRQLCKHEKTQQENIKIKEEFYLLQEHMKEMSAQIKLQQEKQHDKMKKLSKLCQQQSQRVENLCEEAGKYKEEIERLTDLNTRLAAEQKNELFHQKKEEDLEKNEQIIVERHELEMKLRYLKMLKNKARKLMNFKEAQEINRKVQTTNMKTAVFFAFYSNLTVSNNKKHLQRILLKSRAQQFHSYLRSHNFINQKYNKSIRFLRSRQGRLFFALLSSKHQQKKSYKQKTYFYRQKHIKQLKIKCFSTMKELLDEKYSVIQNQQLLQYHKEFTIRKFFRCWLRYLSDHQLKAQSLSQLHHLNAKKRGFSQFYLHASHSLSHHAKAYALQSFLPNIRKITYFHLLTKSIGATLFKRSMKANKICRIKQHSYLNCFISSMRDRMVRKKIAVEQQIQRKRQEEKGKVLARKQLEKERGGKLNKFKQFLCKIRKQLVCHMLNREHKQYNLAIDKYNSKLNFFISSLRNNYVDQLKHKLKISKLTSSNLFVQRTRQFFNKLTLNLSNKKARIHSQSKQRLLKSFYRWKAYIIWNRMSSYQLKFNELQPQIAQITQMQRDVADEKKLLLHELEDKELIISQYIKKCEEYEYALESKEIKYAKLKNIYSQSTMEETISTTKRMNSRESITPSREDIYLKYLPNGEKGRYTNDYDYQATNDGGSKGYIREQLQQYPRRPAGKFNFVSSFKRF